MFFLLWIGRVGWFGVRGGGGGGGGGGGVEEEDGNISDPKTIYIPRNKQK